MGNRSEMTVDELRARIAKLEARLEIDHVYKTIDGVMRRVEIPEAERDDAIDGITCRNETINLLEAENGRLRMFVKSMRFANQLFKDGYNSEGISHLEASLMHLDEMVPGTKPNG